MILHLSVYLLTTFTSFIQKESEHFFCIYFLYIPLSPVFGLGDLCIQERSVLPDELAFLLADLLSNIIFAFLLCIVEDIKLDSTSQTVCGLRNDAVFVL